MNRGQSFIAHAQSPELLQPGDGAFDGPPGLAQIAAMRCSAFGNLMLYAALRQRLAVGTAIIGTVGLDTPSLNFA